MLKKVGIVAAAATAAMIALTPLAFAHTGGDSSVERDQVNVCDFDQDITNPGTIGPVPLLTQTQTDNCTNIGDTEEPADD